MEWILLHKEGLAIVGAIILIALVGFLIYSYVKLEQITVKKKAISTSKWVIPFVIFSIFFFTAIAVFVQIRTSIELSPTLITCFYAFCTGELWMLASIKKTKLKSPDNGSNSMIGNILNNFSNRAEEQDLEGADGYIGATEYNDEGEDN